MDSLWSHQTWAKMAIVQCNRRRGTFVLYEQATRLRREHPLELLKTVHLVLAFVGLAVAGAAHAASGERSDERPVEPAAVPGDPALAHLEFEPGNTAAQDTRVSSNEIGLDFVASLDFSARIGIPHGGLADRGARFSNQRPLGRVSRVMSPTQHFEFITRGVKASRAGSIGSQSVRSDGKLTPFASALRPRSVGLFSLYGEASRERDSAYRVLRVIAPLDPHAKSRIRRRELTWYF